jgi:hypothetical protein
MLFDGASPWAGGVVGVRGVLGGLPINPSMRKGGLITLHRDNGRAYCSQAPSSDLCGPAVPGFVGWSD